MTGVDAREATLDVPSSPLEVVRDRYGRGGAQLGWKGRTPFAQPFEQHVAAQREAGHDERLPWMRRHEPPDDQVEIGGLSGMVHPGLAIDLAIAAAEDQDVGCPAAPPSLGEHAEQIVGADRSFETMQE